jgi:hypothetical protein
MTKGVYLKWNQVVAVPLGRPNFHIFYYLRVVHQLEVAGLQVLYATRWWQSPLVFKSPVLRPTKD